MRPDPDDPGDRAGGRRATARERPVSERGTYIVIEGIDGTGKTELAARLVPPLLRRGHSVSSFRSPTDKFLRREYARMIQSEPFAAALCFTVDRALLRPDIEAALDQGDVVVQDRSFYSTLAYQSPGLATEQMRELERIRASPVGRAGPGALPRRSGGPGHPDGCRPAGRRMRSRMTCISSGSGRSSSRCSNSRAGFASTRSTSEHTIEQAMNALLAAGLSVPRRYDTRLGLPLEHRSWARSAPATFAGSGRLRLPHGLGPRGGPIPPRRGSVRSGRSEPGGRSERRRSGPFQASAGQ